jgi:hypothetical protein
LVSFVRKIAAHATRTRTNLKFLFFQSMKESNNKLSSNTGGLSEETADDIAPVGEKEYQTLFWVPMLFQTVKNTEALIEEMLDMIQDFHDQDHTVVVPRKSVLAKRAAAPKRRQQILGEVLDSEVVTTRVDVVLKSDNTKYNLLSVLKRHFLFSQLRDYELEDVIDVMQALYVQEGEVIIQEGDPGELFYILEEGKSLVSLFPLLTCCL